MKTTICKKKKGGGGGGGGEKREKKIENAWDTKLKKHVYVHIWFILGRMKKLGTCEENNNKKAIPDTAMTFCWATKLA